MTNIQVEPPGIGSRHSPPATRLPRRSLAGHCFSNPNICRSVEDRHPESGDREPRDLSQARTSKKSEGKPKVEQNPNPNIQELEDDSTH